MSKEDILKRLNAITDNQLKGCGMLLELFYDLLGKEEEVPEEVEDLKHIFENIFGKENVKLITSDDLDELS